MWIITWYISLPLNEKRLKPDCFSKRSFPPREMQNIRLRRREEVVICVMGTKEMRDCKKKLGLGNLIQTNDFHVTSSTSSLRSNRFPSKKIRIPLLIFIRSIFARSHKNSTDRSRQMSAIASLRLRRRKFLSRRCHSQALEIDVTWPRIIGSDGLKVLNEV